MAIRNVNTNYSIPGAEQAAIDRQRQIGMALQNQAMQPIDTHGGAPISWTQGLAQMLQSYVGGRKLKEADESQRSLADDMNNRLAQGLQNYQATLQGQPEIPSPPPELGGGPARPAVPGDRQQAFAQLLSSGSPELQSMGLQMIAAEPERQMRMDEFQAARDDRISARDQQQRQFDAQMAASQEARRQQQEFQREMAREANSSRMSLAKMQMDNARAMQQQQAGIRNEMMDLKRQQMERDAEMMDLKRQQMERDANALPAPALKIQDGNLDAIATLSSVNSDLNTIKNQIEDGRLDLGLIGNTVSRIRNFTNQSDEQSINLESTEATLQKIRNDLLRLNKGAQTDSDAVREMDSLIKNLDDPKVVKQRLVDIISTNERNSKTLVDRVGTLRKNYGLPMIDVSQYTSKESALGNSVPVYGGRSVSAPPVSNFDESLLDKYPEIK